LISDFTLSLSLLSLSQSLFSLSLTTNIGTKYDIFATLPAEEQEEIDRVNKYWDEMR